MDPDTQLAFANTHPAAWILTHSNQPYTALVSWQWSSCNTNSTAQLLQTHPAAWILTQPAFAHTPAAWILPQLAFAHTLLHGP